MKKEVGIVINSKQTSNQLEPVTKIYPVMGTVITQSQMHALTKDILAHLQDLIPTLMLAMFYHITKPSLV